MKYDTSIFWDSYPVEYGLFGASFAVPYEQWTNQQCLYVVMVV
jgi:hypothetical protein